MVTHGSDIVARDSWQFTLDSDVCQRCLHRARRAAAAAGTSYQYQLVVRLRITASMRNMRLSLFRVRQTHRSVARALSGRRERSEAGSVCDGASGSAPVPASYRSVIGAALPYIPEAVPRLVFVDRRGLWRGGRVSASAAARAALRSSGDTSAGASDLPPKPARGPRRRHGCDVAAACASGLRTKDPRQSRHHSRWRSSRSRACWTGSAAACRRRRAAPSRRSRRRCGPTTSRSKRWARVVVTETRGWRGPPLASAVFIKPAHLHRFAWRAPVLLCQRSQLTHRATKTKPAID